MDGSTPNWGPLGARKKPVQARSRATVDAILTAATEILVAEGYEKASTNRIAERAGVSVGSLYQYFPNKEALVVALAESHTAGMLELLAGHMSADDDAPLPDACRRLVRALLAAHAMAPQLHRVLIEQIPRITGFGPIRHYDELIMKMVRVHLDGRPEPLRPRDLELATFVLVHSVQAVTHAAVLQRPDALEDENLAEELTQLVLRYLVD